MRWVVPPNSGLWWAFVNITRYSLISGHTLFIKVNLTSRKEYKSEVMLARNTWHMIEQFWSCCPSFSMLD